MLTALALIAGIASSASSAAACVPAESFAGTICTPNAPGRHPTILLLGGSTGGDTMGAVAARFAADGYVAASIAYFKAPGLPAELEDIPVETVGKALDDVMRRSDVDAERIGIMGLSKGGEFALLAASMYPAIHAVVADVPSPFAWEGISPGAMPDASSWTVAGKPVPYVRYASAMIEPLREGAVNHRPVDLRKGYDAAMQADKAIVSRAMFHLERIRGPVLMLAADDDQIWDSCAQAQIGMHYLRDHHHPYADEYVHYPSAGHMFLFSTPENPITTAPEGPGMTLLVGGTPAGNLTAKAQGWSVISKFLARAFSAPVALRTVASVRVATGYRQSLHQLPVAASVLDRAALGSSSSYTLDTALRELPGFDYTRSNSLFTNYGQLRVSFAGSGTDRGLVLFDGIPAQDGFGGQIDWSAYPLADVERAELLLGAGSALYGAGAVGGVLDLRSASIASAPNSSVTFNAGSAAYNETVHASGEVAPRLNASATFHRQALRYWTLPPGYQSRVDGESAGDASVDALRLRYALGNRDNVVLGERAAWDHQFEGRPNYTFSRQLSQTDLNYTHALNNGALHAVAYSRTAFVTNTADQYPAKPGVLRYVQHVPTSENGAALMWTAQSGPSQFELRADMRHVAGDALQYKAGGVQQSESAGVQNFHGFAAQEAWQNGRLEAVAGARADSVHSLGTNLERSDGAVSPRIAVRYNLLPSLALRTSVGSGLRTPYLNELLRGYIIGGVSFLANPHLEPERSRTGSFGLDLLEARSHLSFDAFDTTVNDAIMFRTIDRTHEQRSNIARTRTQAYLLNYVRSLGPCSRLSASYSEQNARVAAGPADIIGKQLQYVPSRSASVAYQGRSGIVQTGVSVSYLGQAYADDLNSEPLGTALLVGAHLRIPLRARMTLDVDGENLTDKRYLSSIDRYAPPRLITIGLTIPIDSSNSHTCSESSTP